MKTKTILYVLLCLGLNVFTQCGKSDPSAEDVFLGKLSAKTWTLTTASLDSRDVTILFPNLQLTFTRSKQYTATGAVPPVWKETGTFALSGTSPNFNLIRDDGIVVTIIELGTKLILEFQYDKSLAGGRNSGVSGKYHFEFKS